MACRTWLPVGWEKDQDQNLGLVVPTRMGQAPGTHTWRGLGLEQGQSGKQNEVSKGCGYKRGSITNGQLLAPKKLGAGAVGRPCRQVVFGALVAGSRT